VAPFGKMRRLNKKGDVDLFEMEMGTYSQRSPVPFFFLPPLAQLNPNSPLNGKKLGEFK
jgi:hypothetical protein